jgi:hypothetical protein
MKHKRNAPTPPKYRVILINPGAAPMAAKKTRRHAKRRTHAKKRHNPTANPANPRRARRRARRANPHRRHARRRSNPTTGKLRAAIMGVIGGVASELIDYGTDQISSFSPTTQGATSVGLHAAGAVAAAFVDPCLEAGLVATGVKTLSQRVRTHMALAPKETPVKKPMGAAQTAATLGLRATAGFPRSMNVGAPIPGFNPATSVTAARTVNGG